MPYIFLDSIHYLKDNHIEIKGDTAHYIVSVLRHKKGDNLILFNSNNDYFEAKITGLHKKKVALTVKTLSPPETESPLDIVLCQSLLKGYKMDIVVQKATELGVKEIIPLITERSQIQYTRKVERWRKIATEASRQSGRIFIPHISLPAKFPDNIKSINKSGSKGVIFYEPMDQRDQVSTFDLTHSQELNRKKYNDINEVFMPEYKTQKMYILIGPEGGFTTEEINLSRENSFNVLSLGKRILRAETAAISAITLFQFLYGDLNTTLSMNV